MASHKSKGQTSAMGHSQAQQSPVRVLPRRVAEPLPRQSSELSQKILARTDPVNVVNVGILDAELYLPSTYVSQEALQAHDKVGSKYTEGLMQRKMAFCGDCEDIYSICLTVVRNLIRKSKYDYKDIGHLEVGTETTHDKSKSVKSVLMKLFESSGNLNVEGVDCKNACYGGTAALFNAVQWVQSMEWDGRLAIVVAADIAIYEDGPARPTGGAGAVAMLIGPNAPIVLEPGHRFTYSAHSYDFFKPRLDSEYPAIDGPLSVMCYLHALEACYIGLGRKVEHEGEKWDADSVPYFLFHSPYMKLVRKAFGRLLWCDYRRNGSSPKVSQALAPFAEMKEEDSFHDKALERVLLSLTEDEFKLKVDPSCLLSRDVGNMYCGSLYGSLLSLLHSIGDELSGKRVAMFSYGSGLCSTMYLVRVLDGASAVAKSLNLSQWLDNRIECNPEVFASALSARESAYTLPDEEYSPTMLKDTLRHGTFCVEKVDPMGRRFYHLIEEKVEESFTSQAGVEKAEDLPVPVCGLS